MRVNINVCVYALILFTCVYTHAFASVLCFLDYVTLHTSQDSTAIMFQSVDKDYQQKTYACVL